MNFAENSNPEWADRFGLAVRNGNAFPLETVAQMSTDPGALSLQAGSVSRGYTEMTSLGQDATGVQNIGLTYHRTADERLEAWQNTVVSQ